MPIKLKEEAKKKYIAFGKTAKVLGERSSEDIRDLAIMAQESGNPNLKILFDELPPLDELKGARVEAAKQILPKEEPKK